MPTDMTQRSILAIRTLMTAKKLTGADIGREMGKGDDGVFVRNALAGRSDRGLREISDFLRAKYGMPASWPELEEVQAIPIGRVEHVGTVGAGPGQSTQPGFDPVEVPQVWITPQTRGMTVSGDSMYPFLWDGDHIICRVVHRPIPGKVMIARTPDGIVVKTLAKGSTGFELRSLAPGIPAIPVDESVQLLGLLVGRYRPYPKPKNKASLEFDGDGLVPED